jgi:hypothetical protein
VLCGVTGIVLVYIPPLTSVRSSVPEHTHSLMLDVRANLDSLRNREIVALRSWLFRAFN